MKTSSPTHPSRQLVLRARRGNSQAIAELYTRFWRAARTAAYAIVRGFSTAEHVAGDAFRDAAAGLATLREPDRFAPWASPHRPPQGASGGRAAAARSLLRSVPLLDDQSALGDTARAVRSALREFLEWKVDVSCAMSLWALGDAPGDTPGVSPPSFTEGSPGRYFRITRGLLCRRDDDAVIDMGELLLRSGSLAAFRGAMRQVMFSDVFDVYWIDRRSIALSEVEEWVMALVETLVPGAAKTSSLHRGPRYRSALRVDFAGDARPAVIGGVLTRWPGAPEDAQAVHVRIYVEPWASSGADSRSQHRATSFGRRRALGRPPRSGPTVPAEPASTDTPSTPPRS